MRFPCPMCPSAPAVLLVLLLPALAACGAGADLIDEIGGGGEGPALVPHEAPLKEIPSDADLSSFAMLRGDGRWRLYLKRRGDARVLYQFGFDGSAFRFGYDGRPVIEIVGTPADADPSRWAMHQGDGVYRVLVASRSTPDRYYLSGYDTGRGAYVYGFSSKDVVNVRDMPQEANRTHFAALYAEDYYRIYHLER